MMMSDEAIIDLADGALERMRQEKARMGKTNRGRVRFHNSLHNELHNTLSKGVRKVYNEYNGVHTDWCTSLAVSIYHTYIQRTQAHPSPTTKQASKHACVMTECHKAIYILVVVTYS